MSSDGEEWVTVNHVKGRRKRGNRPVPVTTVESATACPARAVLSHPPAVVEPSPIEAPPSKADDLTTTTNTTRRSSESECCVSSDDDEPEEEAQRVSVQLLQDKIYAASSRGPQLLTLHNSAVANCSTAATFEDLASVDFSVNEQGELVRREYDLHFDVDVKIHHVTVKQHGTSEPNPDYERLQSLVKQAREVHAEEFEERFEEQCSKRSGYKLVLMSEKGTANLLGFVMYKVRPDQKSLCISKLAVPKSRRRHGLGQRLMKFIMRYAKDNFSRKQVSQCALSALPGSIKFYQSLGFKQEKARPGGGGMLEEGANGFVPGQIYMTHPVSNKCKFR